MKHRTFLKFCTVTLLLLAVASGVHAQDSLYHEVEPGSTAPDSTPSITLPQTIRSISILGNTTTKPWVVKFFLAIDTGSLYDSTLIAAARTRLHATNLFTKVDIIRLQKPAGIQLFVILIERFPLSLDDIGGELFTNIYGDPGIWWQLWRGRLGAAWDNFRGEMETVRLSASFIQWRSLSLSWRKPFIGTPWSIGLGAGISDNPSETSPWRNRTGYVSAGLGRRLTPKTRAYAAITPVYNDIAMVDTSSDTYPIIDHLRFWESHFSLGTVTDHRDRSFDPRRGWYASTDLRTAVLMPAGSEVYYPPSPDTTRSLFSRSYVQWNTELRLYRPGFFKEDRFAARVKTTLRNREGGALNRVAAGGDATIRGYGNSTIGVKSQANNRVLLSGEYRFPIWTTPDWGLELFEPYFPALGPLLRGFFLRLDGGIFADGGYLWHDALNPRGSYAYAYSGGVGARVMCPPWERSGAVEIIPMAMDPNTGKPTLSKHWGWTIYIDLNY